MGLPTRRFSTTYSPEILAAFSPKEVSWLLRVGSAPMALAMFMSELVPYTERPPFLGLVMAVSLRMASRA